MTTSQTLGRAGFLKNQNIARQLAFIAIVAVIGFLAVAGVDLINHERINAAQAQFDEGFQGHLANTETALAFHETRSAANAFLADHREISVDEHAKALAATLAGLAKLHDIHSEAEMKDVITKLEKTVQAYGEKFSAVAASQRQIGLTPQDGLLGALRTSVHQIETRIEGVSDDRLSTLMLTLRRHEKDFLARSDETYATKLYASFADFGKAVDVARSLNSAEKTEIRALADAYLSDFRKVVVATAEIKKVVAVLDELSLATRPYFDQVREDGLKDLSEGQAAVANIGSQTQIIMNATMAIVGILVVLLVWVIARGISQPVVAMTNAMSALAHGNKDTVIPGTGYGNEIGAMASAVQVFKDNLIKADALAAEQLAEQKAKEARAEQVSTRTASFDGVIKVALNTVTSAGQQLQGSAPAMQATAEETNAQSAAHSRDRQFYRRAARFGRAAASSAAQP